MRIPRHEAILSHKFITVGAAPIPSNTTLSPKVFHHHLLQASLGEAKVADSGRNINVFSNIAFVVEKVEDNTLPSLLHHLPPSSATSLHQAVKHAKWPDQGSQPVVFQV